MLPGFPDSTYNKLIAKCILPAHTNALGNIKDTHAYLHTSSKNMRDQYDYNSIYETIADRTRAHDAVESETPF